MNSFRIHSVCSNRNNQEERLWDYTLTIYNMTFEDEADLQITAKASMAEKSVKIKPSIAGKMNCDTTITRKFRSI